MAHRNRFAAASALAAALALAATPAEARHYHRWHHRDGVDAGDVIAGVLILGGIAAVASAASRRDREERYPPPPPYPQSQRYRYDDGRAGSAGLDRAAGMCADEIERGAERVGSVDSVSRDRDGWMVSGALEGGGGFSCRIDNDGRIRDIDLGGGRADYVAPEGDGQWDDDAYARARSAQQEADETPPDWVAGRPEWPGDAPQPTDDGRYSASQAPDFGA